ncbi:hypothetical protein JL100_015295 [Skermanella mucosa]|uniref:hypothetical protein n=1 Tax=Skermanella mucosa TaxID=1789672 RepID=UPI00192BD5EE|nr:hypothetical protein [Skermanella mucosa]UEM18485.1 hypothetical protein JL100_015295 [Skermanella mucosa]
MDKLTVAAVLDRIVFAEPDTFDAADGRLLAALIPERRRRLFGASIAAKMPGGTTSGSAAGVGSVDLKNDDREFTAEVGADDFVRVGQYKLLRDRDGIEIWQVMSDTLDDEPKGALLRLDSAGEPTALLMFAPRRLRLPFLIGNLILQRAGWRDWKRPVRAGAAGGACAGRTPG